jgi:hypothetical protein
MSVLLSGRHAYLFKGESLEDLEENFPCVNRASLKRGSLVNSDAFCASSTIAAAFLCATKGDRYLKASLQKGHDSRQQTGLAPEILALGCRVTAARAISLCSFISKGI